MCGLLNFDFSVSFESLLVDGNLRTRAALAPAVPPTPKLHAPKLSSSRLHSHRKQILSHVEVADCFLLPLFTLLGFQTD
jgi:hypothetical protein